MGLASSRSHTRLDSRDLILVGAAVLLGVGAFVLSSALTYRLGFPLDDSWIHAVYARNLAIHGEWAFQLGHPAAGSTAPLWTLLLVPGFWLGLEPLWWSLCLGCLALFGLGILAELLVRTLEPTYSPRLPWIALFVACEWHMLWAAASGMETALHALLLTAVVALLVTGSRRHMLMGLLTGLSVWVRPDGLTLAAPVLLALLLEGGIKPAAWRAPLRYVVGFGLLFLPFVGMNLWLSGAPMPNTFYAKQIEYAAWQSRPLAFRAGVLMQQLATGPGILLIPGVVAAAAYTVRRRRWRFALVLAWCVAYFVIYMLRLPAYQHGRYLMPAMPTFFLLGWLGFLESRMKPNFGRYPQTIQTAFQLSIALLTVGFLVLGARAYGQDVALIESEMVDTATWVAGHVPPGAVVAAHDIGALGYFDDHPLVDLAGLVSPEVLPFMRDEPRLADFLDQRGVRYLIAFPDLYPRLAMASKLVFSTGGRFAPEMGGQNMTVYCWSCR